MDSQSLPAGHGEHNCQRNSDYPGWCHKAPLDVWLHTSYLPFESRWETPLYLLRQKEDQLAPILLLSPCLEVSLLRLHFAWAPSRNLGVSDCWTQKLQDGDHYLYGESFSVRFLAKVVTWDCMWWPEVMRVLFLSSTIQTWNERGPHTVKSLQFFTHVLQLDPDVLLNQTYTVQCVSFFSKCLLGYITMCQTYSSLMMGVTLRRSFSWWSSLSSAGNRQASHAGSSPAPCHKVSQHLPVLCHSFLSFTSIANTSLPLQSNVWLSLTASNLAALVPRISSRSHRTRWAWWVLVAVTYCR